MCDGDFRVYLAPLGGGDLREAFRSVVEDAAAHGKRAKFHTLTQQGAAMLAAAMPGRFAFAMRRSCS